VVNKSKEFVPPSKDYRKIIINGAIEHGLSEKWINKLEQIPTND
jgi:hypothetical protein